jgi:hypothetical protein
MALSASIMRPEALSPDDTLLLCVLDLVVTLMYVMTKYGTIAASSTLPSAA